MTVSEKLSISRIPDVQQASTIRSYDKLCNENYSMVKIQINISDRIAVLLIF